jgi:hypothetical protein
MASSISSKTKVYTLTPGYYNRIIKARMRKYEIKLDSLECHFCEQALEIGEEVAAKQTHSKMKRMYYHVPCARRINLLD